MKTRIRPRAWLDIEETMTHLKEKAGLDAGARFYDKVRASVARLADYPEIGPMRQDLEPAGIRSWHVARPFENWLIFYRISGDYLEILRIKHGAMNLPALFED